MAVRDLACQELVELVTDYLEDALSPDDRASVERHLATCDGCTAYLAQMRNTLRMLGRLSTEDIPEQAQQDLLSAFRDLRNQR